MEWENLASYLWPVNTFLFTMTIRKDAEPYRRAANTFLAVEILWESILYYYDIIIEKIKYILKYSLGSKLIFDQFNLLKWHIGNGTRDFWFQLENNLAAWQTLLEF